MADKSPLQQQQERDDEDVEDLFQVAVQPVALEVPGYQQPGSPHQQAQQQQQGGAGGKEPLLPPGSMSSSASAADSVPVAGPDGSRPYTTLTEPVTETLKRDVLRVVTNLRNVVFPNPYRQSSSLRDWDLWGPFFFIIFLALILSSSASKNKSEVFATVFGVLSLGAIILTLNVLLLGGRIIFFQSLSVLGYCLFPLDLGALVCLFVTAKLIRFVVIVVMLVWSSWAAYPFVSGAVSDARKALAVYPVFLLYISMGFLVLGND